VKKELTMPEIIFIPFEAPAEASANVSVIEEYGC